MRIPLGASRSSRSGPIIVIELLAFARVDPTSRDHLTRLSVYKGGESNKALVPSQCRSSMSFGQRKARSTNPV